MNKRYFVLQLLFAFFVVFTASAQTEKGSVSGRVVDGASNNDPMPFADVFVKGTLIGASTDFDGNYTLKNVPAGEHILAIHYTGYKSVEVPITVAEGGILTMPDQVLSGDSENMLEEVQVVVNVSKEKESALLVEQKKATEMKVNIGKEQMKRMGVSNVAAAVTKTSGISKQEGSSNIYVRGLGDRYNITTLNGLPLPSNNPSRKNIDLNIFSTDILEYVSISKTYSLTNYGDFGGANIDIKSKSHKGKKFIQIGSGVGINSNATSVDQFYLQDGPTKSGFYNSEIIGQALAVYPFNTSWDNKEVETPINLNFSLTGGVSIELSEESKINIFATGSFDNGYTHKEGVDRGSITAQGLAVRDLTFDSYVYETNATAMFNLHYKINKNHHLKFNSVALNSTEQKLEQFEGIPHYYDIEEGMIKRSNFDKTTLTVNQLLGKHTINDQFDFDWGVSYNDMKNKVPDRRVNTFVLENDALVISILNATDNHRLYQRLDEDEYATNAKLTYKFAKDVEEEEYKGKVILGYSGRFKEIDFQTTQYNFEMNGNTIPIDPNNIDAFFNIQNQGIYTLESQGGSVGDFALPQTYGGTQTINSGFVMGEYKPTEKLTLVAGLRGEKIIQDVNWSTSEAGTGRLKTDEFELLPNIAVKYALTEDHNLKLATSKTYTLPQFKEKAPFFYEDVTELSVGTPTVAPSENYNVDLKWEWFPNRGELLSVTAFGKYIKNPINDINISSNRNELSYLNTGDNAKVFGGEFELKKALFNWEDEESGLEDKLTFGMNLSYLYSNQTFDSQKIIDESTVIPRSVQFTNSSDKLTGASDLLINADLTYLKKFEKADIQATAVFNYFSDRIYAIGVTGRGNLVDKGVPTLDLILKSNIGKFSLGLNVKNILNPTIERIQETQNVVARSYKNGVNAGLSVSYKID